MCIDQEGCELVPNKEPAGCDHSKSTERTRYGHSKVMEHAGCDDSRRMERAEWKHSKSIQAECESIQSMEPTWREHSKEWKNSGSAQDVQGTSTHLHM
jgi:hypothetical protein